VNIILFSYLNRGDGGQQSLLVGMLPLIIIFIAFYFIIMYPQLKAQKKHRNFLNSLKNGDKVITNSGIYGIITGIEDKTVKLKIAPNVLITIDKSAIAGLQPEEKKEK